MDDFLSEQEQWERVKAWVRSNGIVIVVGLSVGVAAVFGMGWWKDHKNAQALDASAQFREIVDHVARGDRTKSLALIEQLSSAHPKSPYADQGRLLSGALYVQSNELDKASTALRTVMENTKDKELALVARLRLARVLLAQNKPDDAIATLNGAKAGAFEPRYQEVRGDAYVAKGDVAAALKEYRSAQQTGAASAVVDGSTLELKIGDLVADTTDPAAKPPATAVN